MMGNKRVYLDCAATTKMDTRVLSSMMPYFDEIYGNASSLHQEGIKAFHGVDHARKQLALLINSEPEEIYFTSGGTESDNFAIKGLAKLSKKKHIIVSSVEHPAILQSANALKREGYEISYIPVNEKAMVDLLALKENLRPDTLLVSVMLANNEVGTLQPLKAIRQIKEMEGVFLHTDAVQAVGNMPVDVQDLGVDLLTTSAHKFYGPKGVGALFVRKGVSLHPLLDGGEHEQGKRSGTYNTPGIVGMGRACEIARQEMKSFLPRISTLRDRLIEIVLNTIPEVYLNGDHQHRLPGNAHFSIPYVEGEALLLRLDDAGFAVSTGSACSSHNLKISHVLKAMGADAVCAQGSLRISLGRENTIEEMETFAKILSHVVSDLRKISPLYRSSTKGA